MSEQRRTTRRRVLKTVGVAGLAGCLGGDDGGDTENGATSTEPSSDGTTAGETMGGEDGTATDTETETTGEETSSGADSMTVFHAGSLESPFSVTETQFEEENSVTVNREAKGSIGSTKKITEQGLQAEVLGVSDFRLLRDMLLPEFGDWYAIFATNALTIAYTDDSTGADEIGPDNWWEVLARDDVKFAHSDPAVDPNGYRSVMAMKLGAAEFQGETLFDQSTSEKLVDKAIVPTGTETELYGQLQSGKIDYAWEYQSAGASQDVNTVDLQPSVDLSEATAEYAEHYAKVEVEAGGNTYTGASIAYGIAVPSVAEAPELGAKWVEFMITDPGRTILKDNGFVPVEPAVVPAASEDAVPETVLSQAEAQETLGPLQL